MKVCILIAIILLIITTIATAAMLGIYIKKRKKKKKKKTPQTDSDDTNDDLIEIQVTVDGKTKPVRVPCGAKYLKRYYKDMKIDHLVQCNHDPALWLEAYQKQYEKAKETQTYMPVKKLRQLIGQQTLRTIRKGEYKVDGQKYKIPQSTVTDNRLNSVYRTESQIESEIKTKNNEDPPTGDKPKPLVINKDCLEVALEYREKGKNPVVLNMASKDKMGGGFLEGTGAQEEYLCRDSTLYPALSNTMDPTEWGGTGTPLVPHKGEDWYPLDKETVGPTGKKQWINGILYTPNVIVFRGTQSEGYPFLAPPFPVGVITAALPEFPKIDKTTPLKPQYEDQKMIDTVKRKIRSVLRVALIHGHDLIVVSAWGCGAYRHPPGHQAKLWKQVLAEPEFKGKFPDRGVVFAIFDDRNAGIDHNPQGNFRPFKDVFP